MNGYKRGFSAIVVAVFLGLSGCGESDSPSVSNASSSGSLSILLTDAPGDYSAVYVTIDEIRVHKAGDDDISSDTNSTDDNETYENSTDINSSDTSWIVVAQPYKTYNLLELQNGLTEELGEANISTGKYTQMRLVLGDKEDNGTNSLGNPHPYANYVIFTNGSDVSQLKVPSNVIKQNHNFVVIPDSKLTLTIDFDANKSIIEAGGSGKYILKPVLGLVSVEGKNEDNNETDDSSTDNNLSV